MPLQTVNTTTRFDADALLSQMPRGILRWGSTVFLLVTAGLLAMAWYIRYPQTIDAPFVLETDVSFLFATDNGQLGELPPADSSLVKKGDLLAVLLKTDASAHTICDSIKSPVDGLLQYHRKLERGCKIKEGEPLFLVKNQQQANASARLQVPAAAIGKIQVGRHVLLYFENYPVEEFGTVSAQVAGIGKIPVDNNYIIYLELPETLETSQKVKISSAPVLRGHAAVLIDNPRLLERLIQPLKMILDKQRAEQAARQEKTSNPQYSQKGIGPKTLPKE